MGKGWKKKYKQQQATKNHQQPSGHQQPERACLYTPPVQPGPEEKQHYADENTHRNRQIRLGWWQNTITAVAAGVGLVGLLFLYWSLDTAERSANAAKAAAEVAIHQAKAGERPWVEVGTAVDIQHPNPLTPDKVEWLYKGSPIPTNFPFYAVIAAKNYGRSPALQAYTFIETKFVGIPRNYSPTQVPPPFAKECAPSSPHSQNRDEALFPGSGYTYPSIEVIMGDGVGERMRRLEFAYFVFGCIRYKDSFNAETKEFYQTDFCRYYWLGDTPHRWQPCTSGNSVR